MIKDLEDLRKNTNEPEIPELDAKTANQLLNNVLSSCEMKPNLIPVETLEQWGNYKKPAFNIGRAISYIFTVILILLPLLFFTPTIVAERTNVTVASSAEYDIHIKTLIPIGKVTAKLDGVPVGISEKGNHEYIVDVENNGTLVITATAINGQKVSRTCEVTHIDKDKPELKDFYSKDGKVYLTVIDAFSGIDYNHISGLTPESYNSDSGLIVFAIPKTPSQVVIPDMSGNELTLLLSPTS